VLLIFKYYIREEVETKWIIDGNYDNTMELRFKAADAVCKIAMCLLSDV